eukprot:6200439-Pleurochrysis_carterae.AAC.1
MSLIVSRMPANSSSINKALFTFPLRKFVNKRLSRRHCACIARRLLACIARRLLACIARRLLACIPCSAAASSLACVQA